MLETFTVYLNVELNSEIEYQHNYPSRIVPFNNVTVFQFFFKSLNNF